MLVPFALAGISLFGGTGHRHSGLLRRSCQNFAFRLKQYARITWHGVPRVWTLLESCSFSYASPILSLVFFELAHSGSVGPDYLLCPEIGASRYVATRPMISLACRARRFSTEEGRFFWQTEMKFVVYRTPNSRHGFLKTSSGLRKEILGVIGRFAWSERIGSRDPRALPDRFAQTDIWAVAFQGESSLVAALIKR
jgi:hypothetical protein